MRHTLLELLTVIFFSNNFSFQFIIGTGDNLSDFTFSENVAHAHICAEEALNFQTVSVAGKVSILNINEVLLPVLILYSCITKFLLLH